MKNVLFIMPFLGRTGAERVIFNLVNNIDSEKYKAHILLYADEPERNSLLRSLRDDIPVNFLNVKGRARYNLHKIIFGIRKYCINKNIDTMLISDGTANAFISPFLFLLYMLNEYVYMRFKFLKSLLFYINFILYLCINKEYIYIYIKNYINGRII